MIRYFYSIVAAHLHASRREAEIEAVRRVVEMAFGPQAALHHTPAGVPFIPDLVGLSFSITHSKDVCILALTDEGSIGIDTELARPQLERVKSRFINDCDDILPGLEGLLQAWTVKEAVYKAALIPGLALNEIIILPGRRRAEARGQEFRIEYPTLTPHRVTAVAIKTQ